MLLPIALSHSSARILAGIVVALFIGAYLLVTVALPGALILGTLARVLVWLVGMPFRPFVPCAGN
jgi:uncharacterized membrane protein